MPVIDKLELRLNSSNLSTKDLFNFLLEMNIEGINQLIRYPDRHLAQWTKLLQYYGLKPGDKMLMDKLKYLKKLYLRWKNHPDIPDYQEIHSMEEVWLNTLRYTLYLIEENILIYHPDLLEKIYTLWGYLLNKGDGYDNSFHFILTHYS